MSSTGENNNNDTIEPQPVHHDDDDESFGNDVNEFLLPDDHNKQHNNENNNSRIETIHPTTTTTTTIDNSSNHDHIPNPTTTTIDMTAAAAAPVENHPPSETNNDHHSSTAMNNKNDHTEVFVDPNQVMSEHKMMHGPAAGGRRELVNLRPGTGRETQRRVGASHDNTRQASSVLPPSSLASTSGALPFAQGRRTGQTFRIDTLNQSSSDGSDNEEARNLPGQFYDANKDVGYLNQQNDHPLSRRMSLLDRSDLTDLTVMSSSNMSILPGYESGSSMTGSASEYDESPTPILSDNANQSSASSASSRKSSAGRRTADGFAIPYEPRYPSSNEESDSGGGSSSSGRDRTNRSVVSMDMVTDSDKSGTYKTRPSANLSLLNNTPKATGKLRQSTIPRMFDVSPVSKPGTNRSDIRLDDSWTHHGGQLLPGTPDPRKRPLSDIALSSDSDQATKRPKIVPSAVSDKNRQRPPRGERVIQAYDSDEQASPIASSKQPYSDDSDMAHNDVGFGDDTELEHGTSESEPDHGRYKRRHPKTRTESPSYVSESEEQVFYSGASANEDESRYNVDDTHSQSTIASQNKAYDKDEKYEIETSEDEEDGNESLASYDSEDEVNRERASVKVGKFLLRSRRVRTKPVKFWMNERPNFTVDFDIEQRPIFQKTRGVDDRDVLDDSTAERPKKGAGGKAKLTRLEQLVVEKGGYFPVKDPSDPSSTIRHEIARTKDMNPQKTLKFNVEANQNVTTQSDEPDLTIQFGLANSVYRVGKFTIHPGSTKPSSSSKVYYETFYIVSGIVSIVINNSEFHLSTGGHLMVPPMNDYSIVNRSSVKSAEVFFVVGQAPDLTTNQSQLSQIEVNQSTAGSPPLESDQ